MDDHWREVVAEWRGGNVFAGRNKSGGFVQLGTDDINQPGISPMELLLLGVAGCTGMDIASILLKKRQSLSIFKVIVRGKRADTFPRVYKEIEVTYLLWGDHLNPKAVEQAIHLSEKKYCSASIMMQATAKMSSSYQIYSTEEPGGIQE